MKAATLLRSRLEDRRPARDSHQHPALRTKPRQQAAAIRVVGTPCPPRPGDQGPALETQGAEARAAPPHSRGRPRTGLTLTTLPGVFLQKE